MWNLRKELLGLDKKHELHRLLGTLLSKKLSQNEKLNIIEKENNVPRYLVIDFSKADKDFTASDEDVLSISKQLMEQNKEAYEVLAK